VHLFFSISPLSPIKIRVACEKHNDIQLKAHQKRASLTVTLNSMLRSAIFFHRGSLRCKRNLVREKTVITVKEHSTKQSNDLTNDIKQQQEEDKEWIKSLEASQLLKGLLIDKRTPTAPTPLKELTLTSLLGKEVPGAGQVSNAGLRTISSLLTYPLTLSNALAHIHRSNENDEESENSSVRVTNILIVGARAESTLPLPWWKWLLRGSGLSPSHFKINMIGPDVTLSTESKTIDYGKSKLVVSPILPFDKSVLHEHPNCMDLLRSSDVFVLYNPGFGSKILQEKWDATLRLLLMTRKPVICSAHCEFDLLRDLDRLKAISAEEDSQDLGETIEFFFSPRRNPFQSLKPTIDNNEEDIRARVVYCNHSVYAFCSK